MGYSSRYHAASLAAVFIALAIGILIGAALGSDVLQGTAKDLENSLSSDLDDTRAALSASEDELAAERDFEQRVYPAIVGDRLRGKKIALITLGDLDSALRDDVNAALGPTGGRVTEVAAVRLPPNTDAVLGTLGQKRDPGSHREELQRAARRAGGLLVGVGNRFADARDVLLTQFVGAPGGIDGVVLARSQFESSSPKAKAEADTLESGLVQGLLDAGVTVVGAERSGDDPSSVAFFDQRLAASVDSVDLLSGKVALVYALAGAEGDFGVKASADSLLPEPLKPGGGGG